MPTSFTQVKKGYNPMEVDNYIETLESVVKSYKEKDSAIKNAIINAQIAADNIIKDAEKRADNMSVQAIRKLELIKNSVSTQRALLKNFQDEYNALVEKYLHDFNQKDVLPIYASISELEEYLNSISNKITDINARETKEEPKPEVLSVEEPKDPPESKYKAGAGDDGIAELLGKL